ncbi:hypothetical protein [Reinekea thalattae]|uniref:DUF3298 domain-containing protein n=1 Tax=Reinekea thalattae TaxID=2593301 RepID=A0A5C8Z8W5_9GAMM|nr:hypothetical protein [Reinekea thalattae]TXR53719.1 hypothetical protein FME95_03935 [Reinekea thalattae]
MVRTVASFMFLAISSLALARPITIEGVWQGTLGSKDIVACFNEVSGYSWSSYYYLDYLTPIQLTTSDEEPYWSEYEDTGFWELGTPNNETLLGTWRHPTTSKTLPIKLNYIDGREDTEACSRDSFNQRLETYPKVEISELMTFSPERQYRELSFAGRATVQLTGPDPAIDKINQMLKLDKSEEVIQDYFDQRREFLGRFGLPVTDSHDVGIEYWDEHVISIGHYFWAAGTGRNGMWNETKTWSAKTGEEVDLWQWIGSNEDSKKLDPKLKAYLLKGYHDCAPDHYYRTRDVFEVRLNKDGGLQIYEDAYGDGCERFFSVTFEELLPFLSPEAKEIMGLGSDVKG